MNRTKITMIRPRNDIAQHTTQVIKKERAVNAILPSSLLIYLPMAMAMAIIITTTTTTIPIFLQLLRRTIQRLLTAPRSQLAFDNGYNGQITATPSYPARHILSY